MSKGTVNRIIRKEILFERCAAKCTKKVNETYTQLMKQLI